MDVIRRICAGMWSLNPAAKATKQGKMQTILGQCI